MEPFSPLPSARVSSPLVSLEWLAAREERDARQVEWIEDYPDDPATPVLRALTARRTHWA